MLLRVKQLNLSAGRPIAVLHRDTAKKLKIHVDERVEIKCGKCEKCSLSSKPHCKHLGKKIIAVVDLAKGLLKENEIAVSQEVVETLGVERNALVHVEPAQKPLSTSYITKKILKHTLSYTEIHSIISDIVNEELTEVEIAYFVAAVGLNDMNLNEVISLTRAMIKVGKEMKWNHKYVLDKHCCSGVAGNRTTPIVVSVIASAIDHLKLDAVIPKTSSRAITSAAGTADVVEILAPIEFTRQELRKIVEKNKGCLVWNGILGIAPADDKIIQIERLIQLESHEQLVASVLAKKIAMGSTHVLIDIPYGKTAKFTKKAAKHIKSLVEKVCAHFHVKVKCLITNGNQPIGNGMGPALEMRDLIAVLTRNKHRPLDLEKKALLLASELLSLIIPKKEAEEVCRLMLDSGMAYAKFKDIIHSQEGSVRESDIAKKLQLGKFSELIKSHKVGRIVEIDNKKIARIAYILGCPSDKGAGIYIHKHSGEKVFYNEPLFTLYAENKEKLEHAMGVLKQIWPMEIL
ncbi:MAG: thymidine phosphorylase [Candidatus Pacearchaeota archaeon]|nr:thymidine phosphorylase [Candidatus Pacearchaeota archaeon]